MFNLSCLSFVHTFCSTQIKGFGWIWYVPIDPILELMKLLLYSTSCSFPFQGFEAFLPSYSSVYALQISFVLTKSSNLSVRPGLLRCHFAKGLMICGCSVMKLGFTWRSNADFEATAIVIEVLDIYWYMTYSGRTRHVFLIPWQGFGSIKITWASTGSRSPDMAF